MTLSPDIFIGLGTGKFEVKFKTGALGACCPDEVLSGGDMSSSYFILFFFLTLLPKCFHLLRPAF